MTEALPRVHSAQQDELWHSFKLSCLFHVWTHTSGKESNMAWGGGEVDCDSSPRSLILSHRPETSRTSSPVLLPWQTPKPMDLYTQKKFVELNRRFLDIGTTISSSSHETHGTISQNASYRNEPNSYQWPNSEKRHFTSSDISENIRCINENFWYL